MPVFSEITPPKGYSVKELKEYLETIDEQMYPLYQTIYDLTSNKKPNEYSEHLEILGTLADAIAVQTKEAFLFPHKNITDISLKLRIKNIRKSSYLYILGADYFNKFEKLVENTMQTALSPIICDYKKRDKCNLVYLIDVRNIQNNRNDTEELKYYWEEYRKHNENIGSSDFPEIIDLWLKGVLESGLQPLDFLYAKYGGIKVSQNIETVIKELMPFYTEFHGIVRHKLNKKYGDEVITKNGLIPHHIYEMIALQAWKKESVLEHAYPDKRLPNIVGGMEKQNIDADKILKIAEEYYESLGFDPIPEEIKNNFVKIPSKTSSTLACRGKVFDHNSNVKIEYCPQIHLKNFLSIHSQLAKVHYALEKKNLTFSTFNSYSVEGAVGEAMVLSASSPNNLVKNGFVSSTTYTPELILNRLFRMGVHTWFNIPVYYVHLKLMEDLLNKKTDFYNINVHYWKLMEEYAGVEPPIDRNITSFDLDVKFYEDLQLNRLVTKPLSEVLGYQLYDSLCKLAGKYDPEDPNSEPLHNCNLEGSKTVGDTLKEMMSWGSRKGFYKILQFVTGNDKGLSSSGILNYYEPLRKWMKNEYESKDIYLGWGKGSKILDGNWDENVIGKQINWR